MSQQQYLWHGSLRRISVIPSHPKYTDTGQPVLAARRGPGLKSLVWLIERRDWCPCLPLCMWMLYHLAPFGKNPRTQRSNSAKNMKLKAEGLLEYPCLPDSYLLTGVSSAGLYSPLYLQTEYGIWISPAPICHSLPNLASPHTQNLQADKGVYSQALSADMVMRELSPW